MNSINKAKNSPPIKAVLFDLDGTLLDTAPDFYAALEKMAREHSRPMVDYAALRAKVSVGGRAMTSLIFAQEEADFSEKHQAFLVHYAANVCNKSALFDGVERLLETLAAKGVAWGIVTNKPRYLTESILTILVQKNPILRTCQCVVCPEDVCNAKPDPEPLQLALAQLNAQQAVPLLPQNCLYVGDHARDMIAGRAAKMATLAAAFGYVEGDASAWGADDVAQTAQQMADKILAWLAAA